MRAFLLLGVLVGGCVTPSPQGSDPSGGDPPEPAAWDTPEPLPTDAGRVTLHRLNRRELDRTLQDLLPTTLALGHTLPADGVALGFDNNAEALTMSGLQLEQTEVLLDRLLTDAMRPPITVQTTRHEPEDDSWSGAGAENCYIGTHPTWQPCVALWWDQSRSVATRIAHPGPYTVRMSVCQAYNEVDPELVFLVDNEVRASWTVTAGCKVGEVVEAEIVLEAGLQDIGVAQINHPGSKMVAVDYVELVGPLDADGVLPPGRARWYHCEPEVDGEPDAECSREIVARFVEAAWRRPVDEADVDAVFSTWEAAMEQGADAHEALRFAMLRALLSPRFLFRVEVPTHPDAWEREPLSAHELAVRLSYFLWSSQPDDALREVADDGSLLQDEVLEAQVRRMLDDPRADALIDGFGAQWLGLPVLDAMAPDPATFPDFDEALRAAMRAEVEDLAERVLLGDASMMEVLTADERWVEPRLAQHYGLGLTEGARVSVPGRSGAGVLTMAGWLAATSNPTRTSPVRRGAWVTSNLLCEKPPPPPDGVETELDESGGGGSVVEQLAAHRADPVCASCHDQIDPVGLALERFDGIGAARETYEDGTEIPAGGSLAGVGAFDDVAGLTGILAHQTRAERCFVQKSFTYALGRGTTAEDWPFLADIESRFAAGEHRFEELAVAIALSEPFRTHRGGE